MYEACTVFADISLGDNLGLNVSRDHLKFMNIIKDSDKQDQDGHYQISLPLKNLSLKVAENRVLAECRALYHKHKLLSDRFKSYFA